MKVNHEPLDLVAAHRVRWEVVSIHDGHERHVVRKVSEDAACARRGLREECAAHALRGGDDAGLLVRELREREHARAQEHVEAVREGSKERREMCSRRRRSCEADWSRSPVECV